MVAVMSERPTGTPALRAMARKGAAKSQRRRWGEHEFDVYQVRFVHAEPGEPASATTDRFVATSGVFKGRRVQRVTIRIARPLTVNGHDFYYAAAFEALATPRCGTGKLAKEIIPHASVSYGNEKIRDELRHPKVKAGHIWEMAQNRMGQGPGDGSHKPYRRRRTATVDRAD